VKLVAALLRVAMVTAGEGRGGREGEGKGWKYGGEEGERRKGREGVGGMGGGREHRRSEGGAGRTWRHLLGAANGRKLF